MNDFKEVITNILPVLVLLVIFVLGFRLHQKKLPDKNRGFFVLIFFLLVFLSIYGVRTISAQKFYVSIGDISEYNSFISEEEVYIGELRAREEDLLNELKVHYSDIDSYRESMNSLNADIEKYKNLSGFTEVHGEGVIVIVDDGVRVLLRDENPLSIIVHDVDVRKLVNELNNAGAEAISVNNNRMVAGLSEVVCNGPTIKINGVQQTRPYVIKAIGDRYKMANRLMDPEGYGANLMKYGIHYEVLTKTDLHIDSYKGRDTFDHVDEVED